MRRDGYGAVGSVFGPGGFGGDEFSDDVLVVAVLDRAVFVDVERGEEALEDEGFGLFVGAGEEVVGGVAELDGVAQGFGSEVDAFLGELQSFAGSGAFHGDLVEPFTDFVSVEMAVLDGVEEAVLGFVEVVEFELQVTVQFEPSRV